MADPTTLLNNQSMVCPILLTDNSNNQVGGAELDADSATAVLSDPMALTATIADDQSSVLVAALGPVEDGVTVTITGTIGGDALNPGVITFDIGAAATNIVIEPGTPVTNS